MSPSAPELAPQAVDVNDDGMPDGYFFPNEAQYFGAGMKKRRKGESVPPKGQTRAKKTSPWIAHVKKYAAEHGMKYGQALKAAKSTYKSGGALLPAGMTYADLYY
jgi:hypothetical protein